MRKDYCGVFRFEGVNSIFAVTMADGSHWDVGKLKIDIEHYTQMRTELSESIKKMEKAKVSADEALKNIPDEDNVWKERFLHRQEGNKNLQKQLDQSSMHTESDVTIESMSDVALKQLQRKLEKDRNEMEWKLKEYGWRLDQASTALCKAEEEKAAILNQIGHAVVKLKKIQKTGAEVGSSKSNTEKSFKT